MIRWPAYHAGYGAWIVLRFGSSGMAAAPVFADDGETPLTFPSWAAALAWIEEHRG